MFVATQMYVPRSSFFRDVRVSVSPCSKRLDSSEGIRGGNVEGKRGGKLEGERGGNVEGKGWKCGGEGTEMRREKGQICGGKRGRNVGGRRGWNVEREGTELRREKGQIGGGGGKKEAEMWRKDGRDGIDIESH